MFLYLYSAFLVLMTTQRSLQYSFTFTQSHTNSYRASISSTLLFYEAQFRVQHLAQGHFGMQKGKTWDRAADLQVGERPLYPSATATHDDQCFTIKFYIPTHFMRRGNLGFSILPKDTSAYERWGCFFFLWFYFCLRHLETLLPLLTP